MTHSPKPDLCQWPGTPILESSVADPDPSDPYVFGPPLSRSQTTSQRYGLGSRSGSGFFYQQAKKVWKTLIPTVLWILFLIIKKIFFFFFLISLLLVSWRLVTKIAGSGSGSISQRHGSADLDPHKNVMDPQHCWNLNCINDTFSKTRPVSMT